MKFVISILLFVLMLHQKIAFADYRGDTLRSIANSHTNYDPKGLNQNFDSLKSQLGRKIFEDKTIAFNGGISCRECHLDEFSSGDGIPLAIGIGATGKGFERVEGNGEILSRNTLPLWGRGGVGFRSFFWDGKVDVTDNKIVSQFGSHQDNGQALNIAIHLPFAELDEMVKETEQVAQNFKKETIISAKNLFDSIAVRVQKEAKYARAFEEAYNINPDAISFEVIADSISHFIRDSFSLKQTRFYRFLTREITFSSDEISGGLIFYGKGKCVICHSGPYYTDFNYHVIPTPQLGYGKNGFGIDYGRFNVSHKHEDLYAFRTPPLYNVGSTSPYMHSGSISDLKNAVKVHFDPLDILDIDKMTTLDRVEFYRKIKAAGSNVTLTPHLSNSDLNHLVDFLKTLSFETSQD